jgi:hypothetical protein
MKIWLILSHSKVHNFYDAIYFQTLGLQSYEISRGMQHFVL